MTKQEVWILEAEHFNIDGRIARAFGSEAAANREAVKLINGLLDETDCSEKPAHTTDDEESMSATAEWLENYHGAAHCYVRVVSAQIEA
jgi:hypothetical protein